MVVKLSDGCGFCNRILTGERHPLGLREKLFNVEGEIKPYILILKNGKSIASLQQLDTPIADRDVIAVFPPIAGG